MRINAKFAEERKSGIKTYRSKYFIVSEGSNSEPMYFEGLNNTVLAENITIINILRDYATLCNSHPNFIIKMLNEFFANVFDDEITVRELLNKISNCIYDNGYDIDIEDISNILLSKYKTLDHKICKNELEDIFLLIFKSNIYKDLAENFPLYFESQNVTYSPETDKLNMVVDRDEQNFKENQYDEVVEFCQKNKVNLYVSNPTFEFWLMLHFPNVENENKIEMLENKYVTRGNRYLEKRLRDICGYKKQRLDFKLFEPFILDAIKREKNFEEDVKKLKTNLGTNVGLLINEMLKKDN